MKAVFWCNLRQKLTCTIPCEDVAKSAFAELREDQHHLHMPNSIAYFAASFVIGGIAIFYPTSIPVKHFIPATVRLRAARDGWA